MKFSFKAAVWAVTAIIFISCSEDDTVEVSDKKVDAYIQFENVFDGKTFELGHNYESQNNGTLNITTLKYIITDITFYGADGTDDYSVSTEDSFHIVDESCLATYKKYLTNLPDGNYNKISFRYGVSEHVHELGTEAQGDMLVAAKKFGMDWGWTLGYRFLTYEGTYNGDNQNVFKVHNGSHGSDSGGGHGGHGHGGIAKDESSEHNNSTRNIINNKLIELSFAQGQVIKVSDKTSPKVHLRVDIAKILNGKNAIALAHGNEIVLDVHKSPKVAENVAEMFTIAHIHGTDTNFDVPDLEECDTHNANDVDNGGHDHTEGDGHSHS